METIDFQRALRTIESAISRCQAIQPKFAAGTSQHSLLYNRIKALQIARMLIVTGHADTYSLTDLEAAMPPILSILHKTSRAQGKYSEGSKQFQRFEPTIQAMRLAQTLLETEIKQQKKV